jgi:hypothetical protein
MALEQLNVKVEEVIKQQLEETKEEFGSYGKMLEAFLYDYKMKRIKTGELKDIQEATLGAISGDFKSLEDLMRAISRVFVGMAEKLGYREAEAVNESTVLKTRVDSLLQQHETEIKAINAEKEALVQALEKLKLEFNSLQKDAQLFEEKEKNLTDKLHEREEELQRRLDRIGELDEKQRAAEPIAKENEQLRVELQKKEAELSSTKKDHQHQIELLQLQHEKELSHKIKETKSAFSEAYEIKIEQLREKWEEHSEKRMAAARQDEREQADKRMEEVRKQAAEEVSESKQVLELLKKRIEELENELNSKNEGE